MEKSKRFLVRNRRKLIAGFGIFFVVVIALQLIYPTGSTLPFSRLDTVEGGGRSKTEVTRELDQKLNSATIPVFVSDSSTSYVDVKPAAIGLKISNSDRINALDYPLWARLIPSSILWYGNVQKADAPNYQRDGEKQAEFIQTALGDCNLKSKNASLSYENNALKVVPAKDGGTCDSDEVSRALSSVSPILEKPSKIQLAVAVTKPDVDDDKAAELKTRLENATAQGIQLKVLEHTETIAAKDILSWLDFSANKKELTYEINEKKSGSYFAKNIVPKVLKPAGITKVATRNFTETSRKNGASGRTLNQTATRKSLHDALDAKKTEATAAVTTLKPKVEYTRSYTKSSEGIAALLQHYDEDNAGVFGVAFQELSGGKVAAYNGSKIFTTASTYKLFVAYGTLKKVEAKKWKWSDEDIANGRDLAACFDDMIVKSDNACAEALLKKLGPSNITSDIAKLGLASSGWKSTLPQTTANDLRLFLAKLQGGSLPLKSESRDRLLGAMKRNQYRQGIPAGASGQVADKVGFLNGLLHDAAIVYSPKGTYVLAVLSDGSSWANIAELTKKIESLR